MTPHPLEIPAELDISGMLADMRAWGWIDSKIEVACGLSQGYVKQIRFGSIQFVAYQRAARIYNFWLSERDRQTLPPQEGLQNRIASVTT